MGVEDPKVFPMCRVASMGFEPATFPIGRLAAKPLTREGKSRRKGMDLQVILMLIVGLGTILSRLFLRDWMTICVESKVIVVFVG